MHIAIIGGGITGLTAAWELSKLGNKVTVFEAAPVLGGLAYGFREPNWNWHLEYAYHHLFTNDSAILNLLKELGVTTITKRPVTANLLPTGNIVPLDSPIHLFKFPGLTLLDKIRTAFLLTFLKLNPFWQFLESFTAEQLLCSIGGRHAYQVLWEPLLVGKFSDYSSRVSAAWFWARIKKRTPSLIYIEGGFHTLVTALQKAILKNGGKVYTNVVIDSIKTESGIKNNESWKKQNTNPSFLIHHSLFDKVLLTTPTPIAAKILPDLAFSIQHSALAIPHLWAQTLILETREPILDKTYWLNVTDRTYPFLAAVAHSNFMDKKHYGGHHLTYFGNYLPQGHPYLSMNKDQLLRKFMPYIKRLTQNNESGIKNNGKNKTENHNSSFIIHNSYMFTAPFAQPVHEKHYSQRAPKLATAIPGVYLANMDSIYPWDRGTNYAVELGSRAALAIEKDQ